MLKPLSANAEINVFAADPELASGLASNDPVLTGDAAVAKVVCADRGPWTAPKERPLVGLLVIEGVMTRTVVMAGIGCTQLVGSGDILRPWDQDEGFPSIPLEIAWNVLEPTYLAILDEPFATGMAPRPAIAANLLTRTLRQEQSLSIQLAITCVTGVDVRLRVALWHLADRWGHVESAGVVLPLPLTHETLGRLIGTRRPSVTTALTRLSERRLVTRRNDGAWVLHGPPPSELDDFLPSPLGDNRTSPDDGG